MSLEGNKIAASVLLAGIVFMVTGLIAEMLVHPRQLEQSALRPATPQEVAAPAAPAAPEPIGPLLANANPDTGRQIAQRQCGSCHNFAQGGPNGVGPNLYGVVGRDHAAVPGFNYSAANRAMTGHPWDYESINAFIAKPSTYMPGTRMAFAGLNNPSQRADVIAFLRSLSPNPAPLP
jgi:cytochrome c